MTTAPIHKEAELDPQQQAMVRRLKRMALFSSLLMVAGFLAVFGVIAYRLSASAERAAPVDVSVVLPKGAKVLSTAVSGDRIYVTIEVNGVAEVRAFYLSNLQPAGRLKFENER